MATPPLHHHTQRGVRIPHGFLTDVAPSIQVIEELQVCLAFFRLLSDHNGDEAPIAEQQILSDVALTQALRRSGATGSARERTMQGLELATGRGTLIRFAALQGRSEHYWYYLNTPVNRQTIEAMNRGAIHPPRVVWQGAEAPRIASDPAVVFRLYEQNIGTLTPMIADQITRASSDYPPEWIEDAIEEAVTYNHRSWRYIHRILENWQAQGRPERR